jgi:hypothetical protein
VWGAISDFVMMLVIAIYSVIALLFIVYIVPAALVMFLATAYFSIVRFGAYDERPARIVLANGLVWSTIFLLLRYEAGILRVEAALVCSVAMTAAGFAWWRATVRQRDERNGPPLARVTRYGDDHA